VFKKGSAGGGVTPRFGQVGNRALERVLANASASTLGEKGKKKTVLGGKEEWGGAGDPEDPTKGGGAENYKLSASPLKGIAFEEPGICGFSTDRGRVALPTWTGSRGGTCLSLKRRTSLQDEIEGTKRNPFMRFRAECAQRLRRECLPLISKGRQSWAGGGCGKIEGTELELPGGRYLSRGEVGKEKFGRRKREVNTDGLSLNVRGFTSSKKSGFY